MTIVKVYFLKVKTVDGREGWHRGPGLPGTDGEWFTQDFSQAMPMMGLKAAEHRRDGILDIKKHKSFNKYGNHPKKMVHAVSVEIVRVEK